MKSLVEKSMLRAIVVLVFALISLSVNAKSDEPDKVFNYNFNVNSDVMVALESSSCELNIVNSSSNKVTMELSVMAKGDQDQLDILYDYLKNYKPKATSESVELSSSIYTKLHTTLMTPIGNYRSVKMTLSNGKKIKLDRFRIKTTVTIPATTYLKLTTSGCRINMDNVNRLNFTSFSDDVFAKSVSGTAVIKANYSKLNFENLSSISLDVFNTTVTAKKADDIECKSKYSKINIPTAKEIQIEGFDDKYTFGTTGNVNLNTKYSNFYSANTANLTMELFDSNIDVANTTGINISETKYSSLKFKTTKNVKIDNSFDDDIEIDLADDVVFGEVKYTSLDLNKAKSITATTDFDNSYSLISIEKLAVTDAKYSKFKIENISKSISINGFQNNIQIENSASTFNLMDINGKYVVVDIALPKQLAANVSYNSQYGKCSVPANFKVKSKVVDNEAQQISYTNEISGTSKAQINCKGFSMKLSVSTK